MSSSGYTCVRYIFCYVNALLWLVGCGILGVGCWLKAVQDEEQVANLLSAHIVLITLGSVTVIITFFACCGAWFQARWVIIIYFSLVIVLFLVEFTVATLAFVYRDELSDTLKEELLEGIRHHYSNDSENALQVIWSNAHSKFRCCGIDGYIDWYYVDAWKERPVVPSSCCLPEYQNLTDCWSEGKSHYWYKQGCSDQVFVWFVSQLHIVGVVGLVVSFVQLFGLISAMILFCSVRHKLDRGHIYKAYTSTYS